MPSPRVSVERGSGGGKGAKAYTPDSTEKSVVFWIGFFTLLITCVPYWLGFAITPPGYQFIGYPYNIDDHCVYLSWIRQAADGDFFIRNLFTTDDQPVMLFNLLFWAIGLLSRVAHISPWLSSELFRIALSAGLLYLVYRFFRYCIPGDRIARVTGFAFACLSSGFGWSQWAKWQDRNIGGPPIDAFQPEAYTFTSIYLFVHFAAGTLLILGTLFAMLRCAHTGKTRYAVLAGLCAMLLGNIHSYDIFQVSAVWAVFLIALTIAAAARGVGKLWLQSVLALALSLPTVLFTYYVYKHNAVFNARAHSDTRSEPIWHYALGYGVEFILAIVALGLIVGIYRRTRPAIDAFPDDSIAEKAADSEPQSGNVWPPATSHDAEDPSAVASALVLPGWRDWKTACFAACWAVAGLAVIYVPFMFQRKTLMGEHIPLCLLAGWAASALTRNMRPALRIAALSLLVVASLPSNALFLLRDITHLEHNTSETDQRPFMSADEIGALNQIENKTPAGAPVLAFYYLSLYVPGLTGHPVWCGHWSETPDFAQRISEFRRFAEVPEYTSPDIADQMDAERRAFLARTRCAYLIYPTDVSGMSVTDRAGRVHSYLDFANSPPPYLIPVYHNKTQAILKIDLTRH